MLCTAFNLQLRYYSKYKDSKIEGNILNTSSSLKIAFIIVLYNYFVFIRAI